MNPYRDAAQSEFPPVQDPVHRAKAEVLSKIADGVEKLTEAVNEGGFEDSSAYVECVAALENLYARVMNRAAAVEEAIAFTKVAELEVAAPNQEWARRVRLHLEELLRP